MSNFNASSSDREILRMNIRRFLYLPPIILLLTITVSGWFVMDFLGNKARQEIIEEGQTSILTLSTHIFSTLNNFEGAAKSLAGSPWISPALMSRKAQDIEHANSVLDRYNTALNASVSYLMDADGITVASSNRNDPDSFVGKSYSFRPYFQEAAKGHAGRYFALGITSGKRGFYASYPVQNPAGKVVGVVAMKKDIDGFETFFQKYAFCFFVSPEGVIFLSGTPEMVLENLWPLDKAVLEKLAASRQFGDKLDETGLFNQEIVDGVEVTWKDNNYLVSRKMIDSNGWSLVLLTPTDRIRIYKLTGILATIFACFLIIVPSGIIYLKDQSHEAVRQSEESRRLLLNAAGVGIFGVDSAGLLTFVNPAALSMLGFSQEEMTGQDVHNFIHHSHKDAFNNPVESCPVYISYTQAVDKHSTDEVLRRKDGSSFPVDFYSTPIIKDGRVMGAVATFQDITKLKQAEKELRKSEKKIRAILDATPFPIAVVDSQEDTIFFWSRSALELFGHTAPTASEWYQMAYPDPDYRQDVIERWKRFLEKARNSGQTINTGEYRVTCKDGSERICEIYATFLPDSLIVTFNDITERKRMEAKILALSITDQLTGLHNRRGFLSLAEQQLKLSERNKRGVQLYFADLDGLKWINDTLGHEEGDKTLIETANIFRETFRSSDIIARLGGDEFVVLAIDANAENPEILIARLQTLIDTRNNQKNRKNKLSISIGYSYYDPEKLCSLDELMARADKLMYEKKQNKKGLHQQRNFDASCK